MNGQPEQVPPSGKSRRLKIALLVLAGLIVLYLVYRHSLSVAIQSRLDAIRHAGYPATCAELDKWYPQPPAGQNAADVYNEAFAHYNMWTNSNPERAKRYLLPISGMAKLPQRTEPLPGGMKQLVAEYLSDNSEALRLLYQATSMKSCRYPIDLSEGFAMRITHLNKIRQAARLLELEAIHNSEEQKPQQAVESVIASLGVLRSLNQEPMLISYLVRLACQGITIDSLERVLNRTSLTDEQLSMLASGLDDAEEHQSLTRTFVGERCTGTDIFQRIRKRTIPSGVLSGFISGSMDQEPSWVNILVPIYRITGLLDLDEERYLDLMKPFVDTTQLSTPESIAAVSSTSNDVANMPRWHIVARPLLDALAGVFLRASRSAAKLHDAQTALAIQRYRLANSRLPDQLSDLVPKFLPAVLTDPFDGKPLRYKKLAKVYIVYSVGEDTVDNGGAEKNGKGVSYVEGSDITFTVER
jgi:hypothetical protein